ncbi:hypothetical protein NEQG_02694, partial [Nematocida parisii ERTm3]
KYDRYKEYRGIIEREEELHFHISEGIILSIEYTHTQNKNKNKRIRIKMRV